MKYSIIISHGYVKRTFKTEKFLSYPHLRGLGIRGWYHDTIWHENRHALCDTKEDILVEFHIHF